MPDETTIIADFMAARPLVKWTGGKSSELAVIQAAMPETVGRYIEPFLGGGAVMFSIPPAIEAMVNDRSDDLIDLYGYQTDLNCGFTAALDIIESAWVETGEIDVAQPDDGILTAVRTACRFCHTMSPTFADDAVRVTTTSLVRKRRFIDNLANAQRDGSAPLFMAALKSAVYTAIRTAYNNSPRGPVRAAMFWFLREFSYGGMFRTNSRGAFNIPYGGISYNSRTMAGRLAQMASPPIRARLGNCALHCGDFEAFFTAIRPRANDFVFLDPPYDSAFSTYDGNSFTRRDHVRLARCMAGMPAKWMIVIGATDFVRETYCSLPGAQVQAFGKTYQGHILNRNDREAMHLLITNYNCPEIC